MQPKTSVKFDRESFDRVKETIRKNSSRVVRERKKNPRYASLMPTEIGFKITRRCNLRCKYCYLWNEKGHYRGFNKEKKNEELDVTMIERILKETHEAKPNLFLMGGEPLIHRDWEAIAKILEKDPRWTVLSTNGLLLEEKLESILRISPHLVVVVSMDGFQEEYDATRGKGTYDLLMENLNLLLSLKRKGEYKGQLTINCVLNEQIVFRLFEFMEYCESLGIDNVIFSFPWYITEETAKQMDDFYKETFSWLNPLKKGPKPSWHTRTYHLDVSVTDILRRQIEKLNSRIWKSRIRLHPALELDEIEDFLLGKERIVQKKQYCHAISDRFEVHPDGSVSACKVFPELCVGNVYKQGVREIWQSDKFGKIREIMNTESWPVPVCSKCCLLSNNEL